MLYIFKGTASAVNYSSSCAEWHTGDETPAMKGSVVMTFQADGGELELIQEAITKASKKTLLEFAWEFRNNKIAVIKELRERYRIGLLEAKLFAESLIEHAEKQHRESTSMEDVLRK